MDKITPAVQPIEIDPSPVPHLGPARMSWRVRLRQTRHAPESKTVTARPSAAEGRKLLVEQARKLTADCLADPDISQAQIADELAVSQRHLQRSYREAGSSWSKELQSMRMNQARVLFERNPALHVSEVAGAVGYRRPHQFAKAFHRANGLWPKDFRRQCREERMASY